jgi:hypothetical protein
VTAAAVATAFDAASLDPNQVSPGLLGFIIVVIIGVVTWFLARSMSKQLRKLDAGREDQETQPAQGHDPASENTESQDTATNGAR